MVLILHNTGPYLIGCVLTYFVVYYYTNIKYLSQCCKYQLTQDEWRLTVFIKTVVHLSSFHKFSFIPNDFFKSVINKNVSSRSVYCWQRTNDMIHLHYTERDSFNCIIYSHLLKLMQKTSFIGCRFETGEDHNNIKATKYSAFILHDPCLFLKFWDLNP